MNRELKLSDFSVAVYAGLLDRVNPEKRNPILEILNEKGQLCVLLNRQWKEDHRTKTCDLEALVFESVSKTMKEWTNSVYEEMTLSKSEAVPFPKYNITLEHLASMLGEALTSA